MNYLRFFADIDPGYFRLKHAAKTILALLIVLWLLRHDTFLNQLIGCQACGFSMQGVVAKSYRTRVWQVIILNSASFFSFVLGLMLRDSPHLEAIFLITLGFAVNYVRRFGLQTSIAPLMIWMIGLVATVMPLGSAPVLADHSMALVVGLVVAGLVVLLVFPESYPRLFVANSRQIFVLLARGVHECGQLWHSDSPAQASDGKEAVRIKRSMDHLLESNLAIQVDLDTAERYHMMGRVVSHQYALAQTYSLMMEAWRVFKIHDYQVGASLRMGIEKANRELETLFNALVMDKDFSVRLQCDTRPEADWKEGLNPVILEDASLVMALLNMKLGFRLFNQEVSQLL